MNAYLFLTAEATDNSVGKHHLMAIGLLVMTHITRVHHATTGEPAIHQAVGQKGSKPWCNSRHSITSTLWQVTRVHCWFLLTMKLLSELCYTWSTVLELYSRIHFCCQFPLTWTSGNSSCSVCRHHCLAVACPPLLQGPSVPFVS